MVRAYVLFIFFNYLSFPKWYTKFAPVTFNWSMGLP